MKQTIMRYNRWRCDHGWDVDLDGGSTNYHIYGNLCLNGGQKLRARRSQNGWGRYNAIQLLLHEDFLLRPLQ